MTGKTQRAAGVIVVGVDGAAASLAAVRWAVRQAPLYQAKVHLVFVSCRYERASYAGALGVSPWVEGDADGRAVLAAARLEAARALSADCVSSELAGGSPANVLVGLSASAELLVLGAAYPPDGSAGRVPPSMGSVARACLRGAACPVVVVTSPMEPPAGRTPGAWVRR